MTYPPDIMSLAQSITTQISNGLTESSSLGFATEIIAEGLMARDERADKLRKAIQDYLDGNYASARSYRPGKCPHDRPYYEECEACNDTYFQAVLDADSIRSGEQP